MDTDLRVFLAGTGPRAIRNISFPSNLRLLVLAPHPDDFDAIGVTLKFFSNNGNTLDVGVVRTGSGVDDSYRPGLSLADKASLREREQRDSIRFFGLPDSCLTFLPLIGRTGVQAIDSPVNRDVLSTFISTKAPNIIFLPHGNDTNNSHRAMYSACRSIVENLGRPIAAFLNHDPKTIQMRTDLYMPFGPEEAKWKAELLRFHDSQHERNLRRRGHGFDDRILNVNKQIARELSLDREYAEAFEIELYNVPENES